MYSKFIRMWNSELSFVHLSHYFPILTLTHIRLSEVSMSICEMLLLPFSVVFCPSSKAAATTAFSSPLSKFELRRLKG